MSFRTPILLLVFNRPDLTQELINSLEKIKPEILYIVADGPRKNNLDDKAQCKKVQSLFENLNWSCSIHKLYRDQNIGCAKSVSRGITWFFEENEQGIILEDDCIADPSFFPYCETLLERFKENSSIFHISGNNFQDGIKHGDADYYFSIFNHIWGWATWRRAWEKYSLEIEPEEAHKMIGFVQNQKILGYFKNQFENLVHNKIDTWDYSWTFTCWKNQGISILPNKNLVSNIGFEPSATHTRQEDSPLSKLPTKQISFPLVNPDKIEINRRADLYTYHKVFQPKTTITSRISSKLKKLF